MERMNRTCLTLSVPLLLLIALVACGQSPGPASSAFKIHAEPLFEQCASLKKAPGDASLAKDLAALKSPEVATRVAAAGRLGASCDARSVEPLLTMLRDQEIAARAEAVKSLGKLGAPEAIDPLREMIGDPAWQVRLEVGHSLCSFQVHRASYDVLNTLVNPQSTEVADAGELYARCQSILAINQLRDVNFSRKAVRFLIYFQDSPTGKRPEYRELANATLTELKNTRNGPHEFVGMIKQDINPFFRVNAAEWIGKLRIMSGEDALAEAAVNDRDPKVRAAAAKALSQLKEVGSKP